PTSLARLHTFRRFAPIDPTREFLWTAALLRQHAPTLKTFAAIRDQFDRAFLSDDFQLCSDLVDRLDHECGVSLWGVSRRLHLYQVSKGLEAQKKYAEGIRATTDPGSITAYIAFFLSVRSEPAVTPTRLRSQFEDSLGSFSCPPDLRAFLTFHVL